MRFQKSCQRVQQLLLLRKVTLSGLLLTVRAVEVIAFFLIWIVYGARRGPRSKKSMDIFRCRRV